MAVITSTETGGTFDEGDSWVGEAAPGVGDEGITIAAGATINLDSAHTPTSATTTITIEAGATFNIITGGTLAVTGGDTLDFAINATGVLNINAGNLIIGSGATAANVIMSGGTVNVINGGRVLLTETNRYTYLMIDDMTMNVKSAGYIEQLCGRVIVGNTALTYLVFKDGGYMLIARGAADYSARAEGLCLNGWSRVSFDRRDKLSIDGGDTTQQIINMERAYGYSAKTMKVSV